MLNMCFRKMAWWLITTSFCERDQNSWNEKKNIFDKIIIIEWAVSRLHRPRHGYSVCVGSAEKFIIIRRRWAQLTITFNANYLSTFFFLLCVCLSLSLYFWHSSVSHFWFVFGLHKMIMTLPITDTSRTWFMFTN